MVAPGIPLESLFNYLPAFTERKRPQFGHRTAIAMVGLFYDQKIRKGSAVTKTFRFGFVGCVTGFMAAMEGISLSLCFVLWFYYEKYCNFYAPKVVLVLFLSELICHLGITQLRRLTFEWIANVWAPLSWFSFRK